MYPPTQTLEFSATFGTAAGEHVGLTSSDDLSAGPWALFSTGPDGDQLYARTFDDAGVRIDDPLGPGYLGSGHRYRIEYTPASVIYSIDGSPVATHTQQQILYNIRPIVSSVLITGNLVVDWLRMSPYPESCTYQSRVLDAGDSTAHWVSLNWIGRQPVSTTVVFGTRTGNSASPDGSWSGWTGVNGSTIGSPNGRYIQYQVQLTTTTDLVNTPAVESVALAYSTGKLSQTITFNPLGNKTYGDPAFTVAATATSGLTVTFTASGACSITGATVSLTGAGSCTVTAHQPGNATYDPAPDVPRTFTIAKGNQTITFNPLGNKAYGDPAFTVAATATSGLTVTFTASGACSITGATVSLTGAGSCTVTAHQPGDANYNAAPDVPRTFTIAKDNQTITFNPLGNKAYGDPAFTVAATATSGLTVTFTASGACSITDVTVSLTGAGSCTVTAHQPGDANYNAAPDVPRTFTIAKDNQTITFNPLGNKAYGDPAFTVAATASSGLTVTFTASGACSITGATVSLTGAGSCTVTAHQPGDANYNAAPDVPQTFTIAKGNQTITFNPLGNKAYGDPAFTVAATATSGLTVTFTASGACSVTDATVSLTGVGSCTVTAHQPGDANYNAAPDVPQTFTIAKGNQTITFNPLGNKAYGDPAFTVAATASLGPDGDIHGERGVQHHGRHGEPDGGGELHGDSASVGRRQLQRRAGRAADLHDCQRQPDDHVQSAGEQGLWRPGLHGGGDSHLGPDGDVHGERGVQHHGRHGEPDGGGELHGDGASVGRRQLQCRAGRAADLHDRQRQPDDHVQSAGEQGLWRPGLHGGGDSHLGPDGDIHGERGVQHHGRHGDLDGGGQLHGDGASVGRRQLQCRAGRAANLHDRQRQSDDYIWGAAGSGGWYPAIHGDGKHLVGTGGDLYGERAVQCCRRHGDLDGRHRDLHGDGASIREQQLQCRVRRATEFQDRVQDLSALHYGGRLLALG